MSPYNSISKRKLNSWFWICWNIKMWLRLDKLIMLSGVTWNVPDNSHNRSRADPHWDLALPYQIAFQILDRFQSFTQTSLICLRKCVMSCNWLDPRQAYRWLEQRAFVCGIEVFNAFYWAGIVRKLWKGLCWALLLPITYGIREKGIEKRKRNPSLWFLISVF